MSEWMALSVSREDSRSHLKALVQPQFSGWQSLAPSHQLPMLRDDLLCQFYATQVAVLFDEGEHRLADSLHGGRTAEQLRPSVFRFAPGEHRDFEAALAL